MPVLYKKSKFFIDIHNTLFYTDLFLIHELYARMQQDQSISFFFSSNEVFKVCANYSAQEADIALKLETAKKKHKNYLLDLIDMDRFTRVYKKRNTTLQIYADYLYKDCLQKPICGQYLQLTEYGNTIKLLAKDDNFQEGWFYMPFESTFIVMSIADSFTNVDTNKFRIFFGNKEVCIKNHPDIDSYTFEDVKDLGLLAFNRTHPVEVVIPYYEYNAVKNRSLEEQMVEQVLEQRLDFERWEHFEVETEREFYEKYKLHVSTINVPI